jgi:predicted ATP-grasp superfamily ATP-dependent carboligase
MASVTMARGRAVASPGVSPPLWVDTNGTPPPPAIVVGLDSITGLQAARILAARGAQVIGIAEDRHHPCCATRRAERVLESRLDEPDLEAALVGVAATLGRDAVVMPCSDAAVLALSRIRDRLPRSLRMSLGAPETVEALLDKACFAELVAGRDLRAPRTWVIAEAADARRARQSVTFPCVVKPARKTAEWTQLAGREVIVLRDARGLDALIDRLSAARGRWILQDWVPGGDDAMYSSHTFHGPTSAPLQSSVVRKLRQWPPGAGTTTLAVHVAAPHLEMAARDLLQQMGWVGLCELEWKRDAETGELFVIEANPGRATVNLPLAEASGMEILTRAYREAAGLTSLGPSSAPRFGTRWIWWRADRAAAAHYVRNGELTRSAYLRSLGGRPIEAEFSATDPMPFLIAAARGIKRRVAGRV